MIKYLWTSQVMLVVKNTPAPVGDMRCRCNPWAGEGPWRRKWKPTPVFLPENPMDRGAWRATVHGLQRVKHIWATFTFHFQNTFRSFRKCHLHTPCDTEKLEGPSVRQKFRQCPSCLNGVVHFSQVLVYGSWDTPLTGSTSFLKYLLTYSWFTMLH